MTAPARAVLQSAEESAATHCHDHRGPLSLSHGFVPATPPLLRFGKRHAAWDAVAADLPDLHATLQLRRRLDALPELPADRWSLHDRQLQRAATTLGSLAHAYHRVEPRRTGMTPAAVQRPWEEVCRRLGRPQAFLTYADLIVCNWRRVRPDSRGQAVEDMELLVPTVDTPEERVFYLTQVEMLMVGTPLVGAAARAQEAMLAGDPATVAHELEGVSACLRALIRTSLPKIDPNPYATTHVDPAVWAKTVAPLAVPLEPGPPGPSGTSSPLFHLLDVLLGRRRYKSQLGAEARTLRTIFPPHWAAFVEAVAERSVAEYATATPRRRRPRRVPGRARRVRGRRRAARAPPAQGLGLHRARVQARAQRDDRRIQRRFPRPHVGARRRGSRGVARRAAGAWNVERPPGPGARCRPRCGLGPDPPRRPRHRRREPAHGARRQAAGLSEAARRRGRAYAARPRRGRRRSGRARRTVASPRRSRPRGRVRRAARIG